MSKKLLGDDVLELCRIVNIECFRPLSFPEEHWFTNEFQMAEQILCERKFSRPSKGKTKGRR